MSLKYYGAVVGMRLFAKDKTGALVKRLSECVDGDLQTLMCVAVLIRVNFYLIPMN